jgi:molybdopterin synthase catalytic subunit
MDARQKWDLLSVRIIHRVGQLHLGDQIVLVGVTSAHRDMAFQAGEFLMDFLKTQAPFWKKETHITGDVTWLDAQEKDGLAVKRW